MLKLGTAFLSGWLSRSQKPALNSTPDKGTAEFREAESQFNLGCRFTSGDGMAQDSARAADCYLKAANDGHREAQFNLGLMYERGEGVSRDEVKALLWLRKSADLGHAGAQYHLGLWKHRASLSCPQAEASECRIEAFKWLQLAMAQGCRGSESARDSVALAMTWEEVHEGGRRAATFAAAAAKPGSEC